MSTTMHGSYAVPMDAAWRFGGDDALPQVEGGLLDEPEFVHLMGSDTVARP
jgi:hypothetical protein